eukprot:497301_1
MSSKNCDKQCSQKQLNQPKKKISSSEFEQTIIIDYLHKYKGYAPEGDLVWCLQQQRTKYLITENLLCLPITCACGSYLDNLDLYKSGLECFMDHELRVNEYEKDEYKLQFKNKAESKAEAKHGHAIIYVDFQEDPPVYSMESGYEDLVCFESIMCEDEYMETYLDEQNAVNSFRKETYQCVLCKNNIQEPCYTQCGKIYEYRGKALRAASKVDLENLYNMLLNKVGVNDIVNCMFELLNIYRILPALALNEGDSSKEVQNNGEKFQKEMKRKRKADAKSKGDMPNKKQKQK